MEIGKQQDQAAGTNLNNSKWVLVKSVIKGICTNAVIGKFNFFSLLHLFENLSKIFGACLVVQFIPDGPCLRSLPSLLPDVHVQVRTHPDCPSEKSRKLKLEIQVNLPNWSFWKLHLEKVGRQQ